jgi:RNA polymerase sigma-70 factor (ECF subfamily)
MGAALSFDTRPQSVSALHARSFAHPNAEPPLAPDAPESDTYIAVRAPERERRVSDIVPRPPTPHGIRATMSDESAILSRAATGDTAAFRLLYAKHRSDVARLVFRMLGAQRDLDDVVQEVFFQVFRSLKDFRGQSKFSTWLHRVTVNVVLMHRRSARSRPTYAEEVASDITPDHDSVAPDEDADRRERMRAFGRLLDRLAEKKRTVFILHELEGVQPAEIATIVGAPVLTVRTRLFYARRELEAMLADEPSLASLKASFSKDASEGGEP